METPYNQPLFIATSYNSALFIKSSFYLFKNSGNTLCSFCGLCRDGGGLSCWKRIRCVLYPLHRTALHRTCLTHVTCDRPANKCALRLLLPLPLPLSLSVCVCAGVGVFVFVCGTATAGYKQHKHLYLSASVCVCVFVRVSRALCDCIYVCVLYINRPLGGSPSPNTLASPPTSASPFLYLFILPAPLHSSSHFTLLLSLTAPLALRARSN